MLGPTADSGDPYARIVLGDDHENPTRLDAFDVRGDIAYVQSIVAMGKESGGRWMVDVAQPGRYRLALRRWPEELDLPIDGDISPEAFDALIIHWEGRSSAVLRPVRARLAIGGIHMETDVSPGDHEAVLEIDVDATGPTELHAHFVDADGGERGAYYVYVTRLD